MDSPLDAKLLPLLRIFKKEDYEYLEWHGNDRQRVPFMEGKLDTPALTYQKITPVVLRRLYSATHLLSLAIERSEHEVVRRAYDAKLKELVATRRLIQAAYSHDDLGAHKASVNLYGKPDSVYYEYCRRQLARKCKRTESVVLDSRLDEAHEYLEFLTRNISQQGFPWDAIALPTEIRDNGVALTAVEIKELLGERIESYGMAEVIHAVIQPTCGKTTFSFDLENSVVKIPSDEDLLLRSPRPTLLQVSATVEHELTHAVRAVKGGMSKLALLGMGLAWRLVGEEGVTTQRAQSITGAREYEGIPGYLAVCLAYGMDGNPRVFRELYEILVRTNIIGKVDYSLYHGQEIDMDAIVRKAKAGSWSSTLRIFRATTGTTPGACFTKGLVYLLGNIATWKLLVDDPVWDSRFNIGKYDANNPEHVDILRKLELI